MNLVKITEQIEKLLANPNDLRLQIINNNNMSDLKQSVAFLTHSDKDHILLPELVDMVSRTVTTRVSMTDIIDLVYTLNLDNPNKFNEDDYLLLDAIVHHCFSCDLVLTRSGVDESYINKLVVFREIVYSLSEYSIWTADGKVNGLVIHHDRQRNKKKISTFKEYHIDFWKKQVIVK